MDTLLESIRNKYLPGTSTSASASTNAQSATSQTNVSGGDALLGDIRRRYGVSNNEFVAGTAKSEVVVDPKKAEPKEEPTFFERIGNMISGASKNYASGATDAAGVTADLLSAGTSKNFDVRMNEQMSIYQRNLDNLMADLAAAKTDAERNKIEKQIQRTRDTIARLGAAENGFAADTAAAANTLHKTADSLSESANEDITKAKEGLGFGGQLAVDLGVAGSQLAGDVLIGAATGGGALIPMAIRSFGGSAQEARQNGANLGQQVAYGAGSAALSVGIEKLFNVAKPLAKVFGKGIADDVVTKLSGRLAETAAGRAALSAISEGAEEAVEAVLTPVLQRITYDKDAAITADTIADAAYNALIGAGIGGLLGVAGNVNASRDNADAGDAKGSAEYAANDATATTETTASKSGAEAIVAPAAEQERDALLSAIIGKNKNTAAQESTTAVDTNPASHSLEEQARVNQYVDSTNKSLESWVTRVISALASGDLTATKMRRVLNKVSKSAANAIKDACGVDVDGYSHMIDGSAVKHIVDRHGADGSADVTMPTAEDIARIEYVLENFDGCERLLSQNGKPVESAQFRDKNNRPAPVVRFYKQVDGHYYVIEAVPDSADKKVHVISAYMKNKNGESINQALDMSSIDNPQPTPEVPLGTVASASYGTTVAQDGGNVNITKTADNTVGAAQQGFDPFTALQNQYGTLPSGENPVRSDDVPVSTNGTDRVSQSVVTEKGARVTPDEFVPLIENETVKGGFSFIHITNDATVQKAVAEIESIGWDAALREWTAKVRKGITSADVEAMGALLYNNAVNSGDFRLALDILVDYNVSGRNAARALQARRILKKLAPQSRLYMIERSIQRMVDDMGLDQQITIPKAMLDAYTNAENEAARDDVVGEIQQYVADNIPPTKMDKWKALRYTNMLGNFKTQVRNVAGNITMAAINDAQNAVAALIETATRGKAGRAHSVAFGKELLDATRADFAENRDFIVDEYRYADDTPTDAFTRGVMEKRTIFKWKPLEGYRELTNYAMNNAKFGDEAFSRRAYSRALASYLKANKVTAEMFNDPSWRAENTEFLDKARAAAKKNAQEATFRDHNTLSDWVSKIGRRPDTPAAVKAVAEGVLPFRRTPANILVRAAEYSPLGLVKNAVDIAKAARGGDISGTDVIDGIAKTLTGSGIFALGMLLRNAGLLRGGSDDDEKQQAFDELTGHQDYSLELPDGTSITLDWLTPAAMPLFVGAELYDLIKDGGFELKDIERAILSIADPMLEMSMIQGVNDTLDSLQYAEGNNLGQLVGAAALSYLTQGVTNSLLGQVTRSFEDESTMTYVDKDSALPDWMQKELGKVARKTPFLDYNQIPYIDAWGRTEEQGGFMERVVNNLFNPAYVDTVEVGKVETELQRLYDNLGDDAGGIFPTRADKSFSVDGENRNLSADEYVKYATAKGQYSYQFVDEAVNSDAYKNMSDAEKAKLIGNLYGYANYKAKREVVPSYDNETYKKVEQAEKVMSPLEYYVMRDSYDYNNNNAVSQAEAQRYLDTTDLSQTDKAFVWTIINKSWKTNPYK